MKTRVLGIFVMLIGLFASASGWSAEPIPPRVRLLVPAYFYPSGRGLENWRTLISSAAKAPVVAIINPDSGPGKRVDENYQRIVAESKTSRLDLIGYVTLSYAKRPVSAVKADIDSWLYFYPDIKGIFFDEQPSGADQLAFVSECFDYARPKWKRPILVSNPGVLCAPEYFSQPSLPTICTFEHFEGFEKYKLPAWADTYIPDRFATLHYDVKSVDEMRRTLQATLQQRTGFVYITDLPGPMPWGGLPSYWKEEIAEVAKFNQALSIPQSPESVRKQ